MLARSTLPASPMQNEWGGSTTIATVEELNRLVVAASCASSVRDALAGALRQGGPRLVGTACPLCQGSPRTGCLPVPSIQPACCPSGVPQRRTAVQWPEACRCPFRQRCGPCSPTLHRWLCAWWTPSRRQRRWLAEIEMPTVLFVIGALQTGVASTLVAIAAFRARHRAS